MDGVKKTKPSWLTIRVPAGQDDEKVREIADEVIEVSPTLEYLYPILTVVPCQLISYYCARFLNRDVDKPRNLAKSVTVE